MYPIVAITGATGTEKTTLAISVAKKTEATVLPLDQLHRYKYLQEGTGLEIDTLQQVKHFGYQVLSPWEVSGPDKYVLWLRDALDCIAKNGPVIIEGGCTSYLNKILAWKTDCVLGQIKIVALAPHSNALVNKERAETRFSTEKVTAVLEETRLLEANGFVSEAGLLFLLDCEKLWTHPEHEDTTLAWAIRISARIYCPVYLALKGKISIDAARARIVRNVLNIQRYQSVRIRAALPKEMIFEQPQVPVLAKELIATLLQTTTDRGGS